MRFTRSRTPSGRHAAPGGQPPRPHPTGVPRFLQATAPSASPSTAPPAATPVRRERIPVARPGEMHEREADQAASRFVQQAAQTSPASPAATARSATDAPTTAPPRPYQPERMAGITGGGQPLDAATRSAMETHFGARLDHVRVHTDTRAQRYNQALGARAFTQGSDIYYGPGHHPGRNELTVHELAHVLQQTGGPAPSASLSARHGSASIQCSFAGSYLIPGRNDGVFEIDLQTREGALAAPPATPGASGLDGYIRYVPGIGAPNSNVIAMTQIVRLTDQGGADIDPASMPALQAPRGALGQPGLRTADNAATGVEGGYFTDVHHRPNASAPGVPQGSALLPRYNFQPAPAGTTGPAGRTQQPAMYGGGIGGVVGQTPGFKRSDDPADIRSAAMYDTPGTTSATANLDFRFETAALGEDTGVTYGAVHWGFDLRLGHVQNEYLTVHSGTSATFTEALERHRDFYVHEPVTFYFDFNDATLSATESGKIADFLPYLTRNPDVTLSLTGFADQVGGPSRYNVELSERRVAAVRAALLGSGIAAAHITSTPGIGASTAATTNAGTGDQGGSAALGADQSREANRWANRRVVLTFSHPAPAPGPAAAPGP